MTRRWILAFSLLLFGSTSFASTDHPNHARGLNGPYQAAGLDNISLYNGSLTIGIPLGPTYSPGGQLSYGFVLSYNSNVWDYGVRIEGFNAYTTADISKLFNAGVGWSLHIGRLLAPAHSPTGKFMYITPGGGGHRFYQALHYGDGDEDDPDQAVSYTRDGSYLRMTKLYGGNNWRSIEFPNGTKQVFYKSNQGQIPGTWWLDHMEDRFGNRLTVDYDFDDPDYDEIWILTDEVGREHFMKHVRRSGAPWPTIEELDLETVNGERLLYTFNYANDQHIGRSCKDDDPKTPGNVQTPILGSITMPDGTAFKMMEDPSDHWYNQICAGGIDDLSGTLQKIQLPTGGYIEWDYQEYVFPPGESQSIFNAVAGVSERRLVEDDGTTVHGTWTYKTSTVGGDEPEIHTEVVYPTGDCSKHFFSAFYNLVPNWGPDDYHRGWDLGLPFVWSEESGGKYLSTQVWDSSVGRSCATGTGTKLRSTYVLYDHDKLPVNNNYPDQWFNSNRRPRGQRTVFHQDGDSFIDTEGSEYDGVGHYRLSTSTTNIDGLSTATLTRTTRAEFNPTFGIYCYDPDTNYQCPSHTYQTLPVEQNWVLGTFTFTEATELGAYGETSSRQEYLFDDDGMLLKTRVLASGTSRSANDLLTEFQIDPSSGEVTSTRLYGGDTQALDTGPGWTLPSTYQYRTDFTYEMGSLKTSQAYDSAGVPIPFLTYDATIDPESGAMLASRSPSGYETTYSYDSLGRISQIIPQSGAKTVYTYTTLPGQPFKITTQQVEGPTVYAQQWQEFDEFGRQVKQTVETADHGAVDTVATYNARGWPLTQSAPGFPGDVTTYDEYDAFGRAHRITPPDGPAHDVLFDYQGVRKVVQQVSRATSPGVESYVSTEAYSDGFGRLKAVLEPSGSGGAIVPTTYSYDVGGHLTKIFTQDGLTGPTQTREFTYDNRGFLLAERHPEKGAGGNGWVNYYDYDAAGNVGRVLDGESHVRYVYDALARLLRVEDVNNADRPVVEHEYDDAPGFGTGLPWRSIRHNYRELPWETGETDVVVTETFSYNGLQGQVSSRTTDVAPYGYQFVTGWTHTPAGQVSTLDYPACTHAACAGSDPVRSQQFSYDQGQLIRVTGWADSITYHRNGLIDQIQHANGVTDDINRDASGLPRLKRIRTEGVVVGGDWDSFVYAYDGAGSIKAIGSDDFVYDGIGRLVQGSVAGHTRSFTYDAFGNIGSISTLYPDSTFETYVTATDSTTNRLSGGGAVYNTSGSVAMLNSVLFDYDALQRLSSRTIFESTHPEDTYIYTASGERLWEIEWDTETTAAERFSLRDLNGKTLRTYSIDRLGGEQWTWTQDYIYRGGALLAAELPGDERRHFHRDHLGSPRLVTDQDAHRVSRHDYFPYGAEVTDPSQSSERMRFTGHERDTPTTGGPSSLDYMHARYYSAHYGRFLRVDPLQGSMASPQTLNRYTYAIGNPLVLLDPTGEAAVVFCGGSGGCDGSAIQTWGGWLINLENVGSVRFFGAGEYDQAIAWLRQQMNNHPDDFHFIAGYSRGGYTAIELANSLADDHDLTVDLLVTVDPYRESTAGPPPAVSSKLLGRAFNYRQTGRNGPFNLDFDGRIVPGAFDINLGPQHHHLSFPVDVSALVQNLARSAAAGKSLLRHVLPPGVAPGGGGGGLRGGQGGLFGHGTGPYARGVLGGSAVCIFYGGSYGDICVVWAK